MNSINEEIHTRIKKYVTESGVKHGCQIAVTCIGYPLVDFLTPTSGIFWVALLVGALVVTLIGFRYYIVAASCFCALVASLAVLSFNASVFVVTDQARVRYRQVGELSYFEFPASESFVQILNNRYKDKLIVTMQCGAQVVARLPMLPQVPIDPESSAFGEKLKFRRLPALSVVNIDAAIEVTLGTNLDDPSGPGSFGVAAGLNSTGPKDIAITDIFLRSLSCASESVPLLSIVETLPWQPDHVDQLVIAYNNIKKLRQLADGRVLSVADVRELLSGLPSGSYRTLFQFAANSIIMKMINGNVFAEARANIRDNLCLLVQRNPSTFTGIFSSLSNDLYEATAFEFGKKTREAFPLCAVPQRIIDRYSTDKPGEALNSLLESVSSCTSSKNPSDCAFEKKLDLCPGGNCRVGGDIPEEAIFSILDSEFIDVVLDAAGSRVAIKSIEPSECPKFRDKQEGLQFASSWKAYVIRELKEPASCESLAWREKIALAKKRYRDADVCQKKYEASDRQYNEFDFFEYKVAMACPNRRDEMFSVMRKFWEYFIDEVYDQKRGLDVIADKISSFGQFVDSGKMAELLSAIKQVQSAILLICGPQDLKTCTQTVPAIFENEDEKDKLMKIFVDDELYASFNSLKEKKMTPETMKRAYAALSKVRNVLVRTALCDLASAEYVVKSIGKSREKICNEVGLSRYYLVGKPRTGFSYERRNPFDKTEGYISSLHAE